MTILRTWLAAPAIGLVVFGGGALTAGAAPGALDDGQDLLPQASISLDQAIQAAQGAASGSIDEVDLERVGGTLVFNVDVGSHDVKVDATTGDVLSVDSDD